MAWLNYPLRRAVVAAVLLLLCVADASLVRAASASDYTATAQTNTLAFLQGFVTANPPLEALWTGTDFCSWWYVTCDGTNGVFLDFEGLFGVANYTGVLALPELSDDVDGSEVLFASIRAQGLPQKVTGTLPSSWGRLTQLARLDLENNALTGTLPTEWRGMTSLGALFLNNNSFTGTLPSSWGSMISLYTLYLDNNQLEGSIPSSWGGLRVYQSDISNNNLCGCLPDEWKTSYVKPTVDAAVSDSDCATANACEVSSSFSLSTSDSFDDSHDNSNTDSEMTRQEENTLAFLQGFVTANPSLETIWKGRKYCSWPYVTCTTWYGVELDFRAADDAPTFTDALVLPELADDVDGSQVQVKRISATGLTEKVTGTLPSSWGRLTALRTIELHSNALTGTLPLQWRFMKSLTQLRLDDNALDGTLPAAWVRLSTLSTVHLNDNAFSGTLPSSWGAWTLITTFYLNNNRLVGSIPASWGSFTPYTGINLSGNELCGCIPSAWEHIPYNYVVDNALSASECATANACVVQSGDSASASGDGDDVALLTANELNTLKFLRLVGAAVGGSVQSSWSDVWYCAWPNVVCMDNSALIVTLDGARATLSSVTLTGTVQLPELTDDIDGSLVDVRAFALSNHGASVVGTLPSSWSRLTKLELLQLDGNALTGTLPAAWSGMTSMNTLRLDRNQLSGSLPAGWSSLSALYELRLSSNALTGTLPTEWSFSMFALQYLYLNNNQLSGSIPSEWNYWRIIIVDLTNNDLCGCAPSNWLNETRLESRKVDVEQNATDCATAHACFRTDQSDSSATTTATTTTTSTTTTTTTTTTTPLTSEQANTLSFLQSFAFFDASLSGRWVGTDYCSWIYVTCTAAGAVRLDLSSATLSPAASLSRVAAVARAATSTVAATLPALAADVDGSAVAVVEVSVTGQGSSVGGTLPSSWGSLTQLERINLQGNGITGTLPASWSGMVSLQALDLSGNTLSGSVPSSWSTLSKLVSANLTETGLCGCLPAGWESVAVTADAALTSSNCSTANVCPASGSSSKGPNLLPLWCVLGGLGGLLIGVGIGFGVRVCRRRQREEELRRLQASQDSEMEPFHKIPDSPY